MGWIAVNIRKQISEAIPEGSVIPAHTEKEHFYTVVKDGITYPSVTGKLQIIKDQSLINYKASCALNHVFQNWKNYNEENIVDYLSKAENASGEILEDAGDIGTDVHKYRENFFRDWIKTGERPKDILSYIPKDQEDIRAVSALRALDKFCTDYNYEPIVTEQIVYSHKLKVGGSLDDIGFATIDGKKYLILLDVKTSNNFKNHYFFQVAMYYRMFFELTRIRPQRQFILKLSKEDGTYKIEELKGISKLITFARHMLRTNDGIEYIQNVRKDNQKKVVTI